MATGFLMKNTHFQSITFKILQNAASFVRENNYSTQRLLEKMRKPQTSAIYSQIYISEGRESAFLSEITSLVKQKTELSSGCALINTFSDFPYNRTSFTVCGGVQELIIIIQEAAKFALDRLNLENHFASHPRVGVVDHISIHPLCGNDLLNATEAALQLGQYFGQELHIPVLFYGDINGKRLSAVRREISYFRKQQSFTVESDVGPTAVCRNKGLMCIGAVMPVLNYNIRFASQSMKAVSQITQYVRESNEGLPEVEALTLEYGEGFYEVACNLLNVEITPPEEVLGRALSHANEIGVDFDRAYVIGLTRHEIAEKFEEVLAAKNNFF